MISIYYETAKNGQYRVMPKIKTQKTNELCQTALATKTAIIRKIIR